MTESESSDDDYGILKKALDVELPDDFDPNSIPQTGEEYLQHVIYERTMKCEKCVTTKRDFSKFNKNQTVHVTKDSGIQKAMDKFCPTKEWQDKAIKDFIQLRNFIHNTSAIETANCRAGEALSSEDILQKIEESPPKFSEITTYSQAFKILILQSITKYLDNFRFDTGLPHNVGTWVYAILALLEKPLTPDCCFKLREFAKKCNSVRAKLQNDSDESIATPLNLYICIIARYFNQLDLAD